MPRPEDRRRAPGLISNDGEGAVTPINLRFPLPHRPNGPPGARFQAGFVPRPFQRGAPTTTPLHFTCAGRTSILRGLAFLTFGRSSSSTPLRKLALIRPASIVSFSVNCRK